MSVVNPNPTGSSQFHQCQAHVHFPHVQTEITTYLKPAYISLHKNHYIKYLNPASLHALREMDVVKESLTGLALTN